MRQASQPLPPSPPPQMTSPCVSTDKLVLSLSLSLSLSVLDPIHIIREVQPHCTVTVRFFVRCSPSLPPFPSPPPPASAPLPSHGSVGTGKEGGMEGREERAVKAVRALKGNDTVGMGKRNWMARQPWGASRHEIVTKSLQLCCPSSICVCVRSGVGVGLGGGTGEVSHTHTYTHGDAYHAITLNFNDAIPHSVA